MKQRDALLVLGAVMLAVGISAILLASSLATAASPGRRIFFDARSSPPPARTVIEAQRDLPGPLRAMRLGTSSRSSRRPQRSSLRVIRSWERTEHRSADGGRSSVSFSAASR
jgi:hypothetical protein